MRRINATTDQRRRISLERREIRDFDRKDLRHDYLQSRGLDQASPVGILLLLAVPLLTYLLYPPQVRQGEEVPKWAAEELRKMGAPSGREVTLLVLVLIALALWIFAGDFVNATTAALLVILMLMTRVVSWDDMMANKAAWNTLAWFATLAALAEGLSRVGFVKWFAGNVAAGMTGYSPLMAMIDLHRGLPVHRHAVDGDDPVKRRARR